MNKRVTGLLCKVCMQPTPGVPQPRNHRYLTAGVADNGSAHYPVYTMNL